ncbi:heme o synthase [Bacillus taeanensis]|uniref:Protoheme IX farnesyltransferase n=1 Tax=Bacillus taeanensis TaxID=273032 RepID=A0A366XZP0_9BACI|nr:heme o synthase [Bacillus taeanensis]RBW70249.1 protoheme IX farnesyltransferase [Bacillus taeanensis]
MERTRTVNNVRSKVMEPGPLSEPRTGTWKDFITLTKMGIVLSNLITTFAGLWIAAQYSNFDFFGNLNIVIFAILGTALVVAGGTSLNNYIDRDIDKIMPRTKDRPSADGRIPANQVLWVGYTLAAVGTVFLLMTEVMAAVLGLVGLFFYVVLYTMWTKRTTSFNTAVGAVSGAMPPLIGWAAIDPDLSPVAWAMFLVMFIWQMPHFFAIAMKRCEDYRAAGIPMLPVVAGFKLTKRQMVLYVGAIIPVSLLLYNFGVIYTTIAAVLGFGWLAVGIAGFFTKDDIKWARTMFVYSINYLTIMFVLMIAVNM